LTVIRDSLSYFLGLFEMDEGMSGDDDDSEEDEEEEEEESPKPKKKK
jgi:FtsZ-interacting cell division protein YlmF